MVERRKRIDNPKRGCGHLKGNAMYLRADTHPDGTLPAFVVLTPPQLFVERHFRGWKPFQGLAFCIAGLRTPDGRFHTSHAVFDDQATFRGTAHLLCRVEKQVRCRLAPSDHG